jgi:hypothetical protein
MDEEEIDMNANQDDDNYDDEDKKTLVIKLSTYEKIRQSKIRRKRDKKSNQSASAIN